MILGRGNQQKDKNSIHAVNHLAVKNTKECQSLLFLRRALLITQRKCISWYIVFISAGLRCLIETWRFIRSLCCLCMAWIKFLKGCHFSSIFHIHHTRTFHAFASNKYCGHWKFKISFRRQDLMSVQTLIGWSPFFHLFLTFSRSFPNFLLLITQITFGCF